MAHFYNPATDKKVVEGIQSAYGFHRGDTVSFTNDYGVVFEPHVVVGFVQEPDPGMPENTVYIDSDCPWFPVRPDSLKKISSASAELHDEDL